MDVDRLWNKIEACTIEVVNSKNSLPNSDHFFSPWDDSIRNQWFGLKIRPFIGKESRDKKQARQECVWQAPHQGLYKLNFDGASRGNPREAGLGCCIHDWEGRIVASLDKPLGITSNNLAEVYALIEGLLLCRRLGLDSIEIEGDSTIIVNAVRKGSTPNWFLNSYIHRVMDILRDFNHFKINHIYREGNKCVDSLANRGVDGEIVEILHLD